jgi:hypothetical protein
MELRKIRRIKCFGLNMIDRLLRKRERERKRSFQQKVKKRKNLKRKNLRKKKMKRRKI